MTGPVNLSLGTLDPQYCGKAPDTSSAYAPRHGLPILRQLLAQRHGVTPEQVAIFAGASMALTCAFHAVPRDKPVLIPCPGFPAYRGVLDLIGRTALPYALDDDWLPKLERTLARHSVGALLLNSPGNPLGNVIPDADRQRLLTIAFETTVILDETYAGLEFPGSGATGPLIGEAPGAIRIGSFSKRFAAPGLRIGYAIADPATIHTLADINWLLAMSPGTNDQLHAAELLVEDLKTPHRQARTASALEAACDTALSALARHGITARRPSGGPLLWISLPGAAGTGLDLARHCQTHAGIVATPGEAFGYSGAPALRCCFALPPETITPVFDRLGAALAGWQNAAQRPTLADVP
ncbi:pyridoxal phosphate-dependent aminotransferase [Tropicibacter sp. S64]|uniref:pyridoxal phosphate-dependent aminotransferase n=1 Tax=Tropicibacter sp. S64 TaxID=3415122 RepID=UPI003C7E7D78